MANATVTRLSSYHRPWAWSLRIGRLDSETFDAFIVSLKAVIHSRQRKWDSSAKVWLFHFEAIHTLETLLEMHGISYDIDMGDTGAGNHRHEVMSKAQAAAELFLTVDAPPEIVTLVYRTLAKIHHPDHGGSTEKMQRLNAALEVLK